MQAPISTLCSWLHFRIGFIWSLEPAPGCLEVEPGPSTHTCLMGIWARLLQRGRELPRVLCSTGPPVPHHTKAALETELTCGKWEQPRDFLQDCVTAWNQSAKADRAHCNSCNWELSPTFSLITIQPRATFILTQLYGVQVARFW